MRAGAQLGHALGGPFRALFGMGGRAWGWLLLYTLLSAALLGGLTAFVVAHGRELRSAALRAVVPEDWTSGLGFVLDNLLSAAQSDVLINGLTGLSLALVSLVFFRVKERLSMAVEAAHGLGDPPHAEVPFWEQALEELKLLVLYLTLYSGVFWLGHSQDGVRRTVASVLSFGVLFATWAVDFIAPLLQRHGARYSQVIKVLARNPLAALAFGALFSLPVVAVGHLGKSLAAVSPAGTIVMVFGATVCLMGFAAVGGTWLGGQLLEQTRAIPRAGLVTRTLGWVVLLGGFAASSYVLGHLGAAALHKSQILRCQYDIEWNTLRLEPPALGELLRGDVGVGVSVEMRITNPTAVDVEIEKNRLMLMHDEQPVATTQIAPTAVPAGATVRRRIGFQAKLHPGAILQGEALFRDRWRLVLYLEILDGYEFPIFLRTPG